MNIRLRENTVDDSDHGAKDGDPKCPKYHTSHIDSHNDR